MQLVANQLFVELQAPADLNGGVDTDYFSMKNIIRASIFIHLGAIDSQANTLTVTLYEATAVAGTGEQALDIPRAYKYDATNDIYEAVTVEADGTIDCEANAVYVIDIHESELSVNDNYDCLKVTLDDPGVADSYGCIYAIGNEIKNLATALTD